MRPISIVTDSTSDLSQVTARANDIEVVPLSVIHGDKVYKDGITITPETFYPMLTSGPELPKTSQPSIHEFKDVYTRLLDSGTSVISLHISSGLSSTFATAESAVSEIGTDQITVVDSGFLSYGLAFQALEARRLASEGHTVKQILAALDALRSKMELLFTLDTLHYLHKGGRIGKVSALLGNLLNIKPVIRVDKGIYVPSGKARSTRQALSLIVQYMTDTFKKQKVRVAVGHGQAFEAGSGLLEMLRESLNVVGEPLFYEVGPVIGVHTGPGTVGTAVCPVL